MRALHKAALTARLLVLGALCGACGGGAPSSVPVSDGLALRVRVVLPADPGPGLRAAGEDLVDAMARITGGDATGALVVGAVRSGPMVRARVTPDEALGEQGFRIREGALEGGGHGLEVVAATEVGAMYGLYRVAHDMGARWFHPEESFFPDAPALTLPAGYDGEPDLPRFARRGFHEHTQHPIVASDFLLVPEGDGYREYASHYVRWLARNRQNVMSFHMLRTVDVEAWLPYIADIITEAHGFGIEVGMVVGFVDEQQNAFKLIRPDEQPDVPEDDQIRARLDTLLEAGFDHLTLQVGASEFTKPTDDELLSWLDTALTHVATVHPDVDLHAWIHITCDLLAEDGSPFFHLPGRADTSLGALVHTTMYYDMGHPAPVYGCEDFSHQRRFIDEQAGSGRALTFFPETAWWLGFDSNVPLALPITAYAREWDIHEELAGAPVTGHVTFTTGREWSYWQYDHFLTRITWDGALGFSEYLDELAALYGDGAEVLSAAVLAFTDLQVRYFYERDPLLYFYVAGELPQDEVGAQAGILARRPKPSLRSIVNLSDGDFAAWMAGDLSSLESMAADFAVALANVPGALESGTEQQRALYREARVGLDLFVVRIEHALAIYRGAAAVRGGVRADAEARLAEARAISADAVARIREVEGDYRYPAALMRAPKDSLTIYDFGAYEETHTGFFWTRRDDQLDQLIRGVFDAAAESWTEPAPAAVFRATPESFTVTTPDNELAALALSGFLPVFLFAPRRLEPSDPFDIVLAQDGNGNTLPDPETEVLVSGALGAAAWDATVPSYAVAVRDDTGAVLTTAEVFDLALHLDRDTGALVTFHGGALSGELPSATVVMAIVEVTGTDAESAANLVKQVYGVDPAAALPVRLPLAATFELAPVL